MALPGERLLLRLLRVPPPPDPPAGSEGSTETFRAAPGYMRYQLLGWGLKQAVTLFGFLVGFAALGLGPQWLARFDVLPVPEFVSELPYIVWIELVGVAFFLLQLPLSLLAVVLDVHQRWYIVTDRSLRVREGIYRVREKTMSFANIQNLSIEQGPLQRLLGIADLEVKSAGGGEGGGKKKEPGEEALHTAYFRGVDRADQIRQLIAQRQRRLGGAGLGDREDRDTARRGPATAVAPPPAVGPAGGTVEVLAAARDLLDKARDLRRIAPAGDR